MDEEISKKKKHKGKHKQDRIEDADIPETLSCMSDCISPKREKKKKKSKDRALENDSENEISNNNTKTETIQNDESSKVKKKSKHNKNANFENVVSQQINVVDIVDPENGCEVADHEDICSKKKKSKKRKYESDIAVENSDEVEQPRKEKHKKKRKHFDDNEVESNVGNEIEESKAVRDEAVEEQIKKKKKKKKKSKEGDSNDIDDSIQDKQGSVHCEKVNSVNGVGKEVDKIESKQKTIRKTEIDKSFIKSTENESFKSGQWSSVELGDSDRQNKFFRLLGGFKKGGDTSQIQNKFSLGKKPAFGSSNNTPRRTGGNFAMDKKQEDVYTKALESEYDRAMSMNLNRGIGLGFEKPPEEGKKFYIDTKSSKSIKFDD